MIIVVFQVKRKALETVSLMLQRCGWQCPKHTYSLLHSAEYTKGYILDVLDPALETVVWAAIASWHKILFFLVSAEWCSCFAQLQRGSAEASGPEKPVDSELHKRCC